MYIQQKIVIYGIIKKCGSYGKFFYVNVKEVEIKEVEIFQ